MSKYIIENCPANYQNNCRTAKVSEYNCKDYTDCVMKQIVQECRKSIKCFESNEIACPVCSDAASAELGIEILKLLDIEECE